MFTKFIFTCVLPRTFTNVHKVYFHKCLAQNIHKGTKFIFTSVLPRTLTNVHKVYFHMCLAQNIHKCSQSLFPRVSCPEHSQLFTSVHKVYFHVSSQSIHKCSQISTSLAQNIHKINVHNFHMSLAQKIHNCSQMFAKSISTCLLPRAFINVHKCLQSPFSHVNVYKVYFHMSLAPEHSQMITKSISTCLLYRTFTTEG